MPDAAPCSPAVAQARSRWRAAEDRLYPTLINDPSSYQRGLADVQAVVAELRRRSRCAEELIAAEAASGELVATACPAGPAIPADLLVAVACGMADRELAAECERRRRAAVLDDARCAGRDWAVLAGPAHVEELTEGRRVEVHVRSGTVVEATADPWSGGEPYRLDVTVSATDGEHHALSRAFTDRAGWLAEHRRCRRDVESARLS